MFVALGAGQVAERVHQRHIAQFQRPPRRFSQKNFTRRTN